METDPYLPPAARVADTAISPDDEERSAHLRHEARLRSVGVIYWIGAGLALVGLLAAWSQAGPLTAEQFSFLTVVLAAVALIIAIGWGYWTLWSRVRWPGTVLSTLGLLLFPVGTIIHGYILYLMWCAKGRRVLAPDYADVRRRTTHLRYRRTVGDWIALGAVVGVPLLLLGLFVWVGTMLPKDY